MMIGIWAIAAYLSTIMVWVLFLRRNVGEAMILGFLVAVAFNGSEALSSGWSALYMALTDEIVYATVLFVFMGYLLERLGVMERMINLLDSIVGRLRGGPAYVNTLASAALGSVVHNQAAIAATVGTVTIPWMERANISKTTAATLTTGNASLGITFPFSASMFVLVGSATAGDLVEVQDLILPLIAGGLWCVLHRIIVTIILVRRSGAEATPADERPLFRRAWLEGWATLIVFLGIAIPMLLTTGPLADAVGEHLGAETASVVSLIFWIPVLLVLFGCLVGARNLPRSPRQWYALVGDSLPRSGIVGVTALFAFAGANALATTGLPEQLSLLLADMNMPVWLLSLVIGIIALLVAAPLNATATMAAVGTVGVAALAAAGVEPEVAAVAVLIFASGEAAVPPGGPPLYVASGIAGSNLLHSFPKLILYYAVPLLVIGTLITTGVIPLPAGG